MNLYYIGSALNLSGLYMTAGCGALVSIKSGDLNLGGEGQIYLGGFLCAIILSKTGGAASPFYACLNILAATGIAFAFSGLMALVSAVLKILRKADFLFTSFIASAAIIPFIDGLISGPARGKTANLLATPYIPAEVRLPSILSPSPMNISFFSAALLCAGLWLILNRTSWGRKTCMLGTSREFARFAGFDCKKLSMSSAFISGGLHGCCGAAAVLGTYFTCHQGFYAGTGWNAFSAALIAGADPLLLIPSSLFMGFITTYANRYALYNNFGFDVSGLIQAVILFLIAFPHSFRKIHREDRR